MSISENFKQNKKFLLRALGLFLTAVVVQLSVTVPLIIRFGNGDTWLVFAVSLIGETATFLIAVIALCFYATDDPPGS